MGDQSSGKSSVLEALSGIPFPRGTGLVTRCPIRMVMKRARVGEAWQASVSTTTNALKHLATSVAELSSLMDRAMQDVCGGNSFSTDSVVVELVSPDACDLTVVDLPGIIRTVTAGQNPTVIEQVNRLIKTFLLDPRTIILAVIPANQDIATIDILDRAHTVDPTGERTIGVLTKTDLIGPGSEDEVLAVVNNIRKPLRLGYVMVKNRSQREIMENVSTSRAREIEHSFFTQHPVLRKVHSDLFGIGQLSKKLTSILVSRIKLQMSPMKTAVERMLSEVRAELRQLSTGPHNTQKSLATTSDRQKMLVSVVQDYVRHLKDSIRGEYRERVLVRNADLRMYNQVMKKFEEFQTMVADTCPGFKEEDYISSLSLQITQLRGRELPGFMSSQTFYMCMSGYVDMWEDSLNMLVKEVGHVAREVAGKMAEVLLAPYPNIQKSIKQSIETILETSTASTLTQLYALQQYEKDPFTLNDFLQQWVNKMKYDKFVKALDNVVENSQNPANNWVGLKEEIYNNMRIWYRNTHAISAQASAQEMAGILEAYWHLSTKRFVDNCCMLCDKAILGELADNLQDQMYQYIRDDGKLQVCAAPLSSVCLLVLTASTGILC